MRGGIGQKKNEVGGSYAEREMYFCNELGIGFWEDLEMGEKFPENFLSGGKQNKDHVKRKLGGVVGKIIRPSCAPEIDAIDGARSGGGS